MPPQLTSEIISAAIDGLEEKRRKLDEQIAELRTMLPGVRNYSAPVATPEATPGRRKKFSTASRRKMALAQKARWAKIKGESEAPAAAPAAPTTPKRKRHMSKEGRARIVAATKARWERVRAEKAAAKKSTAGKKISTKAAVKATRKAGKKKTADAAPATVETVG